MRALVRAALIASLSGCSFIAARPPQPTDVGTPRCNPGKGAVAVDGVMATLSGVGAIAVAGDSAGGALSLGLLGAAYLGSAFYGSSSANRCRKALDEADDARRVVVTAEPEEEDEPAVKVAPVVKEPAKVAPPAPEPAPSTSTSTSTTDEGDDQWSDFWTEATP